MFAAGQVAEGQVAPQVVVGDRRPSPPNVLGGRFAQRVGQPGVDPHRVVDVAVAARQRRAGRRPGSRTSAASRRASCSSSRRLAAEVAAERRRTRTCSPGSRRSPGSGGSSCRSSRIMLCPSRKAATENSIGIVGTAVGAASGSTSLRPFVEHVVEHRGPADPRQVVVPDQPLVVQRDRACGRVRELLRRPAPRRAACRRPGCGSGSSRGGSARRSGSRRCAGRGSAPSAWPSGSARCPHAAGRGRPWPASAPIAIVVPVLRCSPSASKNFADAGSPGPAPYSESRSSRGERPCSRSVGRDVRHRASRRCGPWSGRGRRTGRGRCSRRGRCPRPRRPTDHRPGELLGDGAPSGVPLGPTREKRNGGAAPAASGCGAAARGDSDSVTGSGSSPVRPPTCVVSSPSPSMKKVSDPCLMPHLPWYADGVSPSGAGTGRC